MAGGPLPGLGGPLGSTLPESSLGGVDSGKEEDFFDMLVSVQSSRLDSQRSPMPRAAPLRSNAGPRTSGGCQGGGGGRVCVCVWVIM